MEPEDRAMAMLYRRHVEFAVGHGVSVHADLPPAVTDRAIRVATRVVPAVEIGRVTSTTAADVPALAGLTLDMKTLAETTDAVALVRSLAPLVDAYTTWIAAETARVEDAAAGLSEHREAAQAALARCAEARDRISAGLDLLAESVPTLEAFRFMNRAMWLQRVRSLNAERVRRGETPDLAAIDVPDNHSWYPFQLAFILLNLPALTDLRHPERSAAPAAVADLLWFPTGGGKTEAYLGLTAYTLATRRLQGTVAGRAGEPGIAVLMRYTLRLLTLQQFQRAAALLCACEIIRRDDEARWGKTPFRIGLWVGQRTTPNTTEQSAEALRQAHGAGGAGHFLRGVGSPAQLTNCPWCGARIEAGRDIRVETYGSGRSRTLIFCGDTLGRCEFTGARAPGEGLPVVVVDEEVYRLLPSVLIATVDKFAQMPWRGETQMLFGQVDGVCSRHGFRSPEIDDADHHPARAPHPAARTTPAGPVRPPDLIVQDELHLISGPLGTLVGLYETAVDRLASWEGRRHRAPQGGGVHGHHPPRAGPGARALRASGARVPAARTGRRGQLLLATARAQ